jgi:subtilisin family serine protease
MDSPERLLKSFQTAGQALCGYQPGQSQSVVNAIKKAGLEVLETYEPGGYVRCKWPKGRMTTDVIRQIFNSEGIRYIEPNYQAEIIPAIVEGAPPPAGQPISSARDLDPAAPAAPTVPRRAASGGERPVRNLVLDGKPAISTVGSTYTPPQIEAAGADGHQPPPSPYGWRVEPKDEFFGKLWGMENIHAPAGWVSAVSSPVVVAVIDTGVFYDHEDLRSNMYLHNGILPNNGGIVSNTYGYDFVDKDSNPDDEIGHGTHCAGILGAVGNNSLGVTGVNWSVRVMAIRSLGAADSPVQNTVDDAVKAVDYARLNGARIISASWRIVDNAGPVTFPNPVALREAVDRTEAAGMLFVVAAGNENTDNDTKPQFPSCYRNPNLISVASINRNDQKSTFSNFGKKNVDIAAPGGFGNPPPPQEVGNSGDDVNILSTMSSKNHFGLTKRYASMAGTSMACPHVAGAAALAWAHPNYCALSAPQVKQLILERARRLDALKDKCVSEATLDIAFLQARYCPPPPVVRAPRRSSCFFCRCWRR